MNDAVTCDPAAVTQLPSSGANVLQCLGLEALHVPALCRPFDDLERRRSIDVAVRHADDCGARAARIGSVADDFVFVVLEVARHDQLALLELRAIQLIAYAAVLRAPVRGHRLEILHLRGRKEATNGTEGVAGAGLRSAAHRRRCRRSRSHRRRTLRRRPTGRSPQNEERHDYLFHSIPRCG